MKIALLSRPGDCFPNIIAQGLGDLLHQQGIEYKIFYDGIPLLMRLLPLNKKPQHWRNTLQFRIRNKIRYRNADKKLLNELKEYNLIVLAECLPNALWRNYLAIEEFKKIVRAKVGSYTDGFLPIAPLHKKMHLNQDDFDERRYDFNLYPSDTIELKNTSFNGNNRAIGVNISGSGLKPGQKKEFIALVDFEQKGYEAYRDQQLRVLDRLNIKTITLQGRYPITEIRKLYQEAALFFTSFPETFGLSIAECLAAGTYVFTPDSGWPMAWRLDEQPVPWGPGLLADCFKVYRSDDELAGLLENLRATYDLENTPKQVFDSFIKHYPHFYFGDTDALSAILAKITSQ